MIRLSVEGIPASFDCDAVDIHQDTGTVSLDLPVEDEQEEQLPYNVLYDLPELDSGGLIDTTLPSSSKPQDSNISNQLEWDLVTPLLLQQRKRTVSQIKY